MVASQPRSRRQRSAWESSSSRVSTFSWPMPRRGSWFVRSTSSAAGCAFRPRPRGRARARPPPPANPFTTSMRKSRPVMNDSTITARLISRALWNASRTWPVSCESSVTPRPWLPLYGLTTHGNPSAWPRARRLPRCRPAAAYRQAEIAEDPVGLFLVGRDLHRDMVRLAGDRRLDALLVLAVPELDQAVVVEPQPRDVTLVGRPHQRRRARPQRAALGGLNELVALQGEHEGLARRFPRRLRRPQRVRQQRAQRSAARATPPRGRPPPPRTGRRRDSGRSLPSTESCRR